MDERSSNEFGERELPARHDGEQDGDAGATIEETMANAYDRLTAADNNPDGAVDKGRTVEDTLANAYDRVQEREADAQAPPEESADSAPAHWSANDRAEFDRMPPEARSFLLRRHRAMEADYTRKTQALAGQRRAADAIHAIAKPYEALIAAEGGTVEGAFRTLLEQAHVLRTAPPAVKAQQLATIARHFGIDLAGAAAPAATPAHAAAMAELAARQTHIEHQVRREAEARSAAASDALRRQVFSFRAARGRDGKPLHPHFDTVADDMSALLAANRNLPLQEAYDRAVWSNPATRHHALGAGTDGASAARKRAADARRSARTPRGGDAGARAAHGRTIEETMTMVYDRLHGTGRE